MAQASYLFAVFAVPLYFSGLTSTGYEPDKAILLRAVAAMGAGGWLVDRLLGSRDRNSKPDQLLVGAAAAVFIAYCLATVLSIDQRLSLWGSQGRQEGLLTHAAYLVLFIIAATYCRTQTRLDRFVTALLGGTVFVCAYGLLQALGFDPVPSGGDPSTAQWPVRATMGQHIFVGTYLVMTIPFAAARFINAWRGERGIGHDTVRAARLPVLIVAGAVATFIAFLALSRARSGEFVVYPAVLGIYLAILLALSEGTLVLGRRICAGGYAALVTVQVITLATTGARGAWLALFAGIPVFAVLAARILGRARLWRAILAASAAGLLALAVLNVPGGPLQPLRTLPGLSRLANLTDSGGAGGSAQGRLLIWQGTAQLLGHVPSVGGTWGGRGRDLVGYGPETLKFAFQHVYPVSLRRATSEIWVWDRAHDIYLDYLIDGGVLALASILALIGVLFFRLIRTQRLWPPDGSWLAVATVTALVSYLVDGVFGLGFPVSLLLFWTLAGVVAGHPGVHHAGVDPGNGRTDPVPIHLVLSAVVAALLAVLWTALFPAASDYPLVLGVLWTAGLAGAVGVLAMVCASRDGRDAPATLSAAQTRSAQRGRPVPLRLVGACAAALLSALLLASQGRLQTAAIAERTGLGYLSSGNSSAGLGYLQEAVANDQYEPQYFTELGGALFTLASTRTDSSLPTYVPTADDARAIDPAQAALLGRDQLFALGRFALERARVLSPLDPDVYNNLGNLYLGWNKPQQAIAEYQMAWGLSHDNPRYLDQQSLAELQQHNVGRAGSLVHQALALDSTFWLSFYTAAKVDDASGRQATARADATQALYWVHNFWPPPPQQQIAELQNLQKAG